MQSVYVKIIKNYRQMKLVFYFETPDTVSKLTRKLTRYICLKKMVDKKTFKTASQ